jgi:hypothetical protein
VGLPDAILFLRISRVGVFQQPRLISSIDQGRSPVKCYYPLLGERLPEHLDLLLRSAFQSVEDQSSRCNMVFSPKRFVEQLI